MDVFFDESLFPSHNLRYYELEIGTTNLTLPLWFSFAELIVNCRQVIPFCDNLVRFEVANFLGKIFSLKTQGNDFQYINIVYYGKY